MCIYFSTIILLSSRLQIRKLKSKFFVYSSVCVYSLSLIHIYSYKRRSSFENLCVECRVIKEWMSDNWRREEKKLLAFDGRCYKRMLRIIWVEKLRNEEVFRTAVEDRGFSTTVTQKKISVDWTYILTQNKLNKRVIKGLSFYIV